MGFIFGQEKGWGPGYFSQLLRFVFLFTSHLVLQSCQTDEPMSWQGLSMELCHLQHWSEGASSEELLLWMRSQHWGKVFSPFSPGEFLHQLLPMYMYFIVSRLVPPHSCFAGLVSSGGAQPTSIKVEPPVARSPPHAGAHASSRDNRAGGSWSPTLLGH